MVPSSPFSRAMKCVIVSWWTGGDNGSGKAATTAIAPIFGDGSHQFLCRLDRAERHDWKHPIPRSRFALSGFLWAEYRLGNLARGGRRHPPLARTLVTHWVAARAGVPKRYPRAGVARHYQITGSLRGDTDGLPSLNMRVQSDPVGCGDNSGGDKSGTQYLFPNWGGRAYTLIFVEISTVSPSFPCSCARTKPSLGRHYSSSSRLLR